MTIKGPVTLYFKEVSPAAQKGLRPSDDLPICIPSNKRAADRTKLRCRFKEGRSGPDGGSTVTQHWINHLNSIVNQLPKTTSPECVELCSLTIKVAMKLYLHHGAPEAQGGRRPLASSANAMQTPSSLRRSASFQSPYWLQNKKWALPSSLA